MLPKTKLNSIEILISKTLINSNYSHEEVVLINNILKEYDDMEEKKNGRIMLSSKCAVCDSKKSKFVKDQKASAILSSLVIKIPLCKIP